MTIILTQHSEGSSSNVCDQVPVLGFNSGRYDLNLIKEYFAELLVDTTKKVFVAKKANTTMFLKTERFLFS